MASIGSLAATRTSHRWAATPGNWDAVNARAIYPSTNEWGIPDLPITHGKPARLVPYNDRHATDNPRDGDAIHFFLDDYRFETMWTQPTRSLPRVQRAGMALTPDFSLYAGMPKAMQLWQAYRSRWCGAWMTAHGITVIPTISWSGPDSHQYCFAGIPAGSTVAISAVGVMRDPDALVQFGYGYTAMRELIRPSQVLCYGRWPQQLDRQGDVTEYPTRWEARHGRPRK